MVVQFSVMGMQNGNDAGGAFQLFVVLAEVSQRLPDTAEHQRIEGGVGVTRQADAIELAE